MNREILFRGKRLDNGAWVFGFPFMDIAPCSLKAQGKCRCRHDGSDAAIFAWEDELHEYNDIEVAPSTVGQYTGLTDKNGVKIFEGDIVKWGHIPGYHENPVRIATVRLAPDILFDAIILDARTVFHYGAFAYAGRINKALEVIGNIHDNPELIGDEDDG